MVALLVSREKNGKNGELKIEETRGIQILVRRSGDRYIVTLMLQWCCYFGGVSILGILYWVFFTGYTLLLFNTHWVNGIGLREEAIGQVIRGGPFEKSAKFIAKSSIQVNRVVRLTLWKVYVSNSVNARLWYKLCATMLQDKSFENLKKNAKKYCMTRSAICHLEIATL